MSGFPEKYLPTDRARFWGRVNVDGECWVWTGSHNGIGHGHLNWGGRMMGAYRIAYEMEVGPIPAGLVLDHLCRNPYCVRPDHLEPVTQGENVMRGNSFARTNAAKTECPKGHPYTAENTRTSRRGWRKCRTCDNERRRVAA